MIETDTKKTRDWRERRLLMREKRKEQTKLTHNKKFNKLRRMTLRLKTSNRTRNPGQRRNRIVKTTC
eukprot:12057053-Heterocapsa_arctica.AAC.1